MIFPPSTPFCVGPLCYSLEVDAPKLNADYSKTFHQIDKENQQE